MHNTQPRHTKHIACGHTQQRHAICNIQTQHTEHRHVQHPTHATQTHSRHVTAHTQHTQHTNTQACSSESGKVATRHSRVQRLSSNFPSPHSPPAFLIQPPPPRQCGHSTTPEASQASKETATWPWTSPLPGLGLHLPSVARHAEVALPASWESLAKSLALIPTRNWSFPGH